MKIDLCRRTSRAGFLVVVLTVALPLGFLSGKAWLAEHWSSSSHPVLWRKAAALEPSDAEYWDHLGVYKQSRIDQGGVHQATIYLQRAVQTNPRSARMWMDLASAELAAGDVSGAQQAYARAQTDYPISAEVAWRYGSFFLYEGDFPKGYAEIKRALLVQPSLATSAVAECWQANPNARALLDQALPAEPPYYLRAINYFLSQNLLDPTLAVWNRELALGMPIQVPQVIPLVNALIDQNRMAEAEQTWNQMLRGAHWPRDRPGAGSLVFNGGFERKVLNGGFGWREIPAYGVRYARDREVAHSGSNSLRIHFSGKANLNFHNVFQLVPVQPGTRYDFSAYVRTEGISTDHGIRFEILDPQHPSEIQILTPNMIGTNSWTLVTSDFTSAKDTRLLEIALRRLFTWKFDNKIRGTAWVDDVALSPILKRAKGRVR